MRPSKKRRGTQKIYLQEVNLGKIEFAEQTL